jgi:signal transduction histidine kinase
VATPSVWRLPIGSIHLEVSAQRRVSQDVDVAARDADHPLDTCPAHVYEVTHHDPAAPAADLLLKLDSEFTDMLTMLDGTVAVRRVVSALPELVGVDIAWVGVPTGADQVVLKHTVNSTSGLIEGLVVPVGAGLGGRVLAARRPLWVSDYCAAPDISPHFKCQVAAEGIKAMIALPIVSNERLLGVLYAANRQDTAFGDRITSALEQVAARTATAEIVAEQARHAAELAVHEERRRLAGELHDSVGAMLFTLGAGIRSLQAEPDLEHDLRQRLSIMEQQAVEVAAALRGSLRVFHTAAEQVALGTAVREHCRAFQERTGVPAHLLTLSAAPPLDASRVSALAGAVREALLNVEKHAEARSVVVSIFADRDRVTVSVSDDGVGLPEDPSTDTGLGLAAVAGRLARVGGSLTVQPNDDGGVTVQACLRT